MLTKDLKAERRAAPDGSPVDPQGLEARLKETVKGEVRFDDGSRALYATDASNYRQVPIGVVVPLDVDDVVATVAACRSFGAPVLSRGGGTSLAGQCCNVAVVMDFSKHVNRLLEIDFEHRWAWVQPGIVLDELRKKAEEHQLTFGPDPATHSHNTLGGMIGNNSCGVHAQMAGKVEENVEELEILTYDGLRMRVGPTSQAELTAITREGGRKGQIYAGLAALATKYADEIRQRFPNIPRRVSGYCLNELLPENGFNVARALVGSESTLVTVLEAKCRLVHSPPCRTLAVLGFKDINVAADAVPLVNRHNPIALEGIDDCLVADMRTKHIEGRQLAMLPPGNGWLVAEFGADTAAAAGESARALIADIQRIPGAPSAKLIENKEEKQELWELRESALGATAKVPGKPETHEGWEDSAVGPDRLGDYLRELRALYDKYGYKGALYGHFGQGCVHSRVTFDFSSSAGVEAWRHFMREASELVRRFGGSLSGEHGDGQARAEFLPIMYGEQIVRAFEEFKAIWDPHNKMNPGKVVHPFRIDQNLRTGPDYKPRQVSTRFSFKDDQHSFAAAANRCVGVGKCRRHGGGTMCPSYMVTREEKHSTRGRARLLFEMLEGSPLRDGWKSHAVKEALDLCLACKGCKGDCPVNVDMATYKAEFLSHYYEGRLRPRSAYAFALMPWWARVASSAPPLANMLAQTPPLDSIVKLAASVAPRRRVPIVAPQSFRSWFAARPRRNAGKPEVLLWPDTWNNVFHPTTAMAAVYVLEDAGFQVSLPPGWQCCGRPLYDYGMLDLAKTMLRRALDALRPHVRAGTFVVGLEPSCVSVFRDEMADLFEGDADAQRVQSQTVVLSEFLQRHGYRPPRLERTVLAHGHCHHKAVLKMSAEEELLRKLGVDYRFPAQGCCGMAGAFGFESGERFEVSMAVGEQALLPAVRAASPETVIVADGFSCREQIAQTTDRQALHLAQLLKMALDQQSNPRLDAYPERRYVPDPHEQARQARVHGAYALGAMALAGLGAYGIWHRRRRSNPPASSSHG